MNNNLYDMRPNYDGLLELVKYIQSYHDTNNFSMIEIGSYSGQSTTFFAKYFHSVISIDPFLNNYDPTDPTCSFASLDYVYEKFKTNIKPYNNIYHLRETSDFATKHINEYLKNKPPLLMVYIDGLHTYDQVTKDILHYKLLLNNNYFLCGHDYDYTHQESVMKAVNEHKKPDMVFSDSSWLIRT